MKKPFDLSNHAKYVDQTTHAFNLEHFQLPTARDSYSNDFPAFCSASKILVPLNPKWLYEFILIQERPDSAEFCPAEVGVRRLLSDGPRT